MSINLYVILFIIISLQLPLSKSSKKDSLLGKYFLKIITILYILLLGGDNPFLSPLFGVCITILTLILIL